MARRTKEQSNGTRHKIVESAIFEFAENGFHNASLSAICDRAGVTRGAFYFHFKNKMDIFCFIWNETIQIINDIQLESEHKYIDAPLDAISDLLKRHFNLIQLVPMYKLRIKIIFEIQSGNKAFDGFFRDKRKLSVDHQHWLNKQLLKSAELGLISQCPDVNKLALVINSYFIGVIENYFLNANCMNIKMNQQNVDFLMSMIINFSKPLSDERNCTLKKTEVCYV